MRNLLALSSKLSCCVTLNFLCPGVFSVVSFCRPCLGRKSNFRFRISTAAAPPLKLDELRWGNMMLEGLFPQALIQSLRYFLLSWRFTTRRSQHDRRGTDLRPTTACPESDSEHSYGAGRTGLWRLRGAGGKRKEVSSGDARSQRV